MLAASVCRCWRTATARVVFQPVRNAPLAASLSSSTYWHQYSGKELKFPGVKPTRLGDVPRISALHTSVLHLTGSDVSETADSPASKTTAATLSSTGEGDEVLDESGFKLGWEESNSEKWEGQSGEERTAILQAALDQVATLGWSEEALRAGAHAVGVADLDAALFPNGAGDLVQYFEEECQKDLVKYLEDISEHSKGAELLRAAVEYRLRLIEPYLDSWPRAMAVKACPSNVVWAMQNLAVMVDEMWYWAGDRSTDINWYSKRAMLSSIFLSTELFMIQDQSPDHTHTWRFLDQRFQDVKELGKFSAQLEGVVRGGVNLLQSGITSVSQAACRASK